MMASFLVESEKLLRRPASWILCGLFGACVVLLVYILTYLLASVLGDSGTDLLKDIRPESIPANVTIQITSIGAVLALTSGVLAMGSEYQWDTVKSSVVSPPGRMGFILGKLLALALFSGLLLATALLSSVLASLTVSLLLGLDTDMPSVAHLAEAVCVGGLILLVYSTLGLFVTVALRGSGRAIAAGLIYVLALEPLISGALGSVPGMRWLGAMLPGQAVNGLATVVEGASISSPMTTTLGPMIAAVILICWTAGLGLASVFLFSWREIG